MNDFTGQTKENLSLNRRFLSRIYDALKLKYLPLTGEAKTKFQKETENLIAKMKLVLKDPTIQLNTVYKLQTVVQMQEDFIG